MTQAYIIIILFVISYVIYEIKGENKTSRKNRLLPYKSRELMTAQEQRLFHRSNEALPGRCNMHSQVALLRLIDIDRNANLFAFNQISQKSALPVISTEEKDDRHP